jgi:hypothetical protein
MDKDPEIVAQELSKEIDRLLAQADEMLAESQSLYAKHGLEPDIYQKLVAANRVTPEQQAQVARELSKLQDEIEDDVRAARDRVAGKTTSPRPRPAGVRV